MSRHNRGLKLDPDAIRRRALAIPGCVEIFASSAKKPKSPSKSSSVVQGSGSSILSYLVDTSGTSSSANRPASSEDLARVTVYCDTGTIATGRVLNGSVRHSFRRNVTSLDVVERCLKYPAYLAKIDWQLVGMTDDSAANNENQNLMNSSSNPAAHQSLKENMELCDVGMAILQGEREKLITHLNSIEPKDTPSSPKPSSHVSPNVSKQPLQPGPAPTSGMEFQFSLAERPMKHVDQCLTDIQKMNKIVHAVSTNGVGTVFLYGNGGVAYTPNIPRTLYQKLSQLRHSKVHSSRPQYVALGSRERYFVAFHDGTVSYKGPKGFDKELRKLTPPTQVPTDPQQKPLWPLRSVAYGSSYDTFCIVFQDGSYKYDGKSFPKELEIALQEYQEERYVDSDEDANDSDEELNDIMSSSVHSNSSKKAKQRDSLASGPDFPGDRYHKKKKADRSDTKKVLHKLPISCINLGPSGEWFLKTEDGHMEWGGITEEMDEAIQELLDDGHRLNYFDFGEDGSYFVSYD